MEEIWISVWAYLKKKFSQFFMSNGQALLILFKSAIVMKECFGWFAHFLSKFSSFSSWSLQLQVTCSRATHVVYPNT